MRAVVQRVTMASVRVGESVRGSIKRGLLVLAAIEKGDEQNDLDYMASKISGLRVFEDENGKMNRNVNSLNGEILIVPQFTIAGNVQRGCRPSFVNAEDPGKAENMFNRLVAQLKVKNATVFGGVFQKHMEVTLVNDGPVTILIDSRKVF